MESIEPPSRGAALGGASGDPQADAVPQAVSPGLVRPAYNEWYWAALGCSAVSGIALVTVCALLALNHARREPYNPLEDEGYKELRAALALAPADEDLKARIRELDLELRREHFDRLAFSENGAYILLGTVLIFVLSMKWVFASRKPLPVPTPYVEETGTPRWRLAVGSTSAFAFLVLCVAAIMGARPGSVPPPISGAEGSAEPVGGDGEVAKWPRFRGSDGLGISPWPDAPTSFDVETGENVLWKAEVPLPGQGSPVLWGRKLFLSGADETRREVYCFDAESGKLLWNAPVPANPRAPAEPPDVLEATGFAAPTPATDGSRVAAMFATGDLACFDSGGKPIWTKRFGYLENHYGYGTSLAIHGKLLFVVLDEATEEDGKSRLLALNMATGERAWEVQRPVAASWATPIVIETPNGEQLITSANPLVISYEPATGKELWRADCMGGDVAPSPVFANDLVFAVNLDAELVAIRPDGQGDVTETHIAWSGDEGLPDIVSPLAGGELVFLVTSSGKVTCYDAKSGESLWAEKLRTPSSSSPSLVGGVVHLWTQKGTLVVFEAAREYKEVGRSELGEEVSASPCFAPGRMYIRGAENLYALGAR